MNSSARLALFLGLQLAAGAAFLACGSDGGDAKTDGTTGGTTNTGSTTTGATATDNGSGTLQLTYSPMYSAYVEGHEAQVPVLLKDTSLRGKGAHFTSSDPTIAVVADSADGATVTVKKDGVVTIKASLNGDTGSAKLTITKFTEEQWKTGQARYSKSDLALISPDGGTISALTLASPNGRNANGACNTCHTAQAKTLKIENGPVQIAGYSDDELITIFTMGKKPESAVMKSQIPLFVWGMFHTWEVTDAEKQGLIAYLRTQTPTANPAMIDYGVKPCPGSSAMLGPNTKLCDNAGNPVSVPGVTGSSSSSTTTTTTTTSDAGVTAPSSDAGAAVTSDAAAARDAN